MPYATQQDMIDRFSSTELIQLSDRDNTADAIDAVVLGRALDDAGGEIDGYLAGRYALPLATTPRILTTVACDIARYRLYDDRATEQVSKRYESAIAFLKLVAEGKVALGPDSADTPTPEGGGIAFTPPNRVFTRDTLSDY